VTLGVSERLNAKACASDSGLRPDGLVIDEAELPLLCSRAWLDALAEGAMLLLLRATGGLGAVLGMAEQKHATVNNRSGARAEGSTSTSTQHHQANMMAAISRLRYRGGSGTSGDDSVTAGGDGGPRPAESWEIVGGPETAQRPADGEVINRWVAWTGA
jgi:hypothetical protein